MERVLIPSLFITNSLTQNLNEGLFLFFLASLNWIKEKSVATLAIHNICDQTQNNPKSVLPPCYIEDTNGFLLFGKELLQIFLTLDRASEHFLKLSILSLEIFD